MRPTSLITICLALTGILLAGCQMASEDVPQGSANRTFRQGEYLPKVNAFNLGKKKVNHKWHEVLIDVKGFDKTELAGYYEIRSTYKPLKRKRGDVDQKYLTLMSHHVYPPTLEYEIGTFTGQGRISKYIWSDREKKTIYIVTTTHENAIKILLGIPQHKDLIIKPASRDEEYIWHEGKFMRK